MKKLVMSSFVKSRRKWNILLETREVHLICNIPLKSFSNTDHQVVSQRISLFPPLKIHSTSRSQYYILKLRIFLPEIHVFSFKQQADALYLRKGLDTLKAFYHLGFKSCSYLQVSETHWSKGIDKLIFIG